jgi:hypothetical protein
MWWRLLGDIAYALYWAERERELKYRGLEGSGVFRVRDGSRVA